MKPSRLPWIVLQWDIMEGRASWFTEIRSICEKLELPPPGVNCEQYDLDYVNLCVQAKSQLEREEEAREKPKLRTYVKFKDFGDPLILVKCNLPRFQRSLLAKFMCGIFPLELETGRYIGTPEEQRLCRVCEEQNVENEIHFIFLCPYYIHTRKDFLHLAKESYENFEESSYYEKLNMMFSEVMIRHTAKYLETIYNEEHINRKCVQMWYIFEFYSFYY